MELSEPHKDVHYHKFSESFGFNDYRAFHSFLLNLRQNECWSIFRKMAALLSTSYGLSKIFELLV